MNYSYFIGIITAIFINAVFGNINDITNTLLPDDKNAGRLAAFGDFTGDRNTDLFLIGKNRQQIDLILGKKEAPFSRSVILNSKVSQLPSGNDTIISSVMPGDFNGDSEMDLLITRQIPGSKKTPVHVMIFWGSGSKVGPEHVILPITLADQPLLMDYNGDMIPDLFGEDTKGNWFFWVSSEHKNFTQVPANSKGKKMKIPNCNVFIDLNTDLTADLMITTEKESTTEYQIWTNQDGRPKYFETRKAPKDEISIIGQSVFADLDADGEMDQIIPVCHDSDCKNSAIYAFYKNQWTEIAGRFTHGDTTWGFALPDSNEYATQSVPIQLRVGDYNLDGYPDVIGVFSSSDKKQKKAFLMMNEKCDSSDCRPVGRTFNVVWSSPLTNVDDVVLAAFYDIYEDGILDIILVSENPQTGDSSIHMFYHNFASDAYFMKVMVVSGMCYDNCPNGKPAYGTNEPGPAYSTYVTTAEGITLHTLAGQLYQSAHFALQLPYNVFGLGQTPNFVEALQVGIPTPNEFKRTREWQSLIPNSQLIIVPHPNDDPAGWINKLFIIPLSNLQVLYTAATLAGSLLFTGIIVGVLHWRERREDLREKLQDAQKFHFDAM